MTVEEFKIRISQQLKDPASVLYDLLSERQFNHEMHHNMSTQNVFYYASEFGLCVDFVQQSLVHSSDNIDKETMSCVAEFDVVFYPGEQKDRIDLSLRNDENRLFVHVESIECEESLVVSDDGTMKDGYLVFDAVAYEIRHEDYVFYRDKMSFRHPTKVRFNLEKRAFVLGKDEAIEFWKEFKRANRTECNYFYLPYIQTKDKESELLLFLSKHGFYKEEANSFLALLAPCDFKKPYLWNPYSKGLVDILDKIQRWATNPSVNLRD